MSILNLGGNLMGCCLLALIVAGAPRLAIILYWLIDSTAFALAFDQWFIPVLGFFLLPWTTLMYVLVAPGGIGGFDYFLIGLGLLFDLGSHGGAGGSARKRKRDRDS